MSISVVHIAIPRELLIEVKVASARAGVTVSEFVANEIELAMGGVVPAVIWPGVREAKIRVAMGREMVERVRGLCEANKVSMATFAGAGLFGRGR